VKFNLILYKYQVMREEWDSKPLGMLGDSYN